MRIKRNHVSKNTGSCKEQTQRKSTNMSIQKEGEKVKTLSPFFQGLCGFCVAPCSSPMAPLQTHPYPAGPAAQIIE